jgi:hypothetical protein
MAEQFINRIREQIGFQQIKFAVRVVGEPAPDGCSVAGGDCCQAGNSN